MERKYLIHFYSELDWLQFRYLELNALLEIYGLIPSKIYNLTARDDENNPFLIITLPSEDFVEKICSRSVLIKHIYELWGGKYPKCCPLRLF